MAGLVEAGTGVNHWQSAGMKTQQEADQTDSKASSMTGRSQDTWQLTTTTITLYWGSNHQYNQTPGFPFSRIALHKNLHFYAFPDRERKVLSAWRTRSRLLSQVNT